MLSNATEHATRTDASNKCTPASNVPPCYLKGMWYHGNMRVERYMTSCGWPGVMRPMARDRSGPMGTTDRYL